MSHVLEHTQVDVCHFYQTLCCNQTGLITYTHAPCRFLTFLRWRNPEGPWSKCSCGRECDHCSFPVSECTPTDRNQSRREQFKARTWVVNILTELLRNKYCCRLHLGHRRKTSSTFRASRLRLISAVSTKVLRSLLLTSVPRSLPAKSTRENLPCSVAARSLRRRTIWRTAWEREELALAEVWPDVLKSEEKGQWWFYPDKDTDFYTLTHTVCADRHTCMHYPAVSSLWPLLPWTHSSPPGPQPEPADVHLPALAAWPSCSGGHKPKLKHNSPIWPRNKLFNQGNSIYESLEWIFQVGRHLTFPLYISKKLT